MPKRPPKPSSKPKPLDTLSAKLREREKRKAALMDKARAIARKGASSGWRDVLKRLDKDDEYSLRIWLRARDMDELDALCGDRT